MRPVVDGATMRLIEEKAFLQGETVEGLMDIVGKELVAFLLPFVKKPSQSVLLLAGKGNNGADGYTALIELLEKGISTEAWQISPPSENSVLERRLKAYKEKGGKVISYPEMPRGEPPTIILDGIYGSGFKGVPDEPSSKAILFANAQQSVIVSIDLPSGVNPATGEVLGEAIFADYTVACHLPKQGCFLGKGWEHTGRVRIAPLPLTTPHTDLCLLEEEDVIHLLPRRRRTQNKFQAGSVVAFVGSQGMMGAASLACEAAYTVGAGYVRACVPKELAYAESLLPREVVKTFFERPEECQPFLDRADSVLLGSGLGRSNKTRAFLDSIWPLLSMPTVVDGDALHWLSPLKKQDIKGKILTPHLGEAGRLFEREIEYVDESLLRDLRPIVSGSKGIIVLKGAPTFILSQGSPTFIMPRGDPGMATAGSGDVLSGMIAGFLAQKMQPLSACMLATWLHGCAGEIAAEERTSYATMASSILEAVPAALLAAFADGSPWSPRHYVPFGRA